MRKQTIHIIALVLAVFVLLLSFSSCSYRGWRVRLVESDSESDPVITVENKYFVLAVFNKGEDYDYENVGETQYVYVEAIKAKDSIKKDTIREIIWKADEKIIQSSKKTEDIDVPFVIMLLYGGENEYNSLADLTKIKKYTLTVKRTDSLKDDVYTIQTEDVLYAIKKKFK